MAIDGAAQEVVKKVNSCCDGCGLFRITKQRAGEEHDVICVNCLKDQNGVVKVGVNDRKQI